MSSGASRNWAGNHAYAGTPVRPVSLEEAAQVVARSGHVRWVGTRHSFNDIADSAQTLVSLDRLAYRHPNYRHGEPTHDGGPEPALDPVTGHVRVSAATRYADLALFLEGHGRTLPNFAFLPHIGIAGTIATGTHGSGVDNPGLAASVVGLALIAADGTPPAPSTATSTAMH